MKKLKLNQEAMKRLEPEQMQSLNGGYDYDSSECFRAIMMAAYGGMLSGAAFGPYGMLAGAMGGAAAGGLFASECN